MMNAIRRHRGASLLEVLVTVLILSFGLLSIGSMMAFAVQMPKMAAHKATAAMLASAHIERVRQNPGGFYDGHYEQGLTYDGGADPIAATSCTYPECSPGDLANMDRSTFASDVRAELPAGGVMVTCHPSPCSLTSNGNVWILWQEPQTNAVLRGGSSDNCPPEAAQFQSPQPRCLYVRFKP